jgi:hypothetical protein
MPIDPRISLGVQPIQVADPIARYGQLSAIQNAQNQNALAQYQLGTAKREEQTLNALNEAYAKSYDPKTGKIDRNLLRESLARGGFGSKLPAIEKTLIELDKEDLLRQKTQGEVNLQPVALAKGQTELLDAKLKQSRSFLDTLDPADPNAPAEYIRWHEANHADPIIGPALKAQGVTVDQSRAKIQAAIARGPQAFADLINGSKLGTEKFMELNKPTTSTVDQGGQKQMFQTPGLGGKPVSVGTYSDVVLPPLVEAQKSRIANAGAARNVTNVNAFTPASVEAQKQFVQTASDERKQLRNAPDALKNIQAAKKLIPTASTFMGKGGEPLLAAASFLNNRLGFGISTQGVTDATVLRTRLFEGILENLKKLDSQPSQEQQRVLGEALGNLGTDPAALEQILDRIAETVEDRVSRFNTDVSEAEARGVKFPFKPQITLPPKALSPKAAADQIPGQSPASGGFKYLGKE